MKITRRSWALSALSSIAASWTNRPSIVVIMTDQQSAGALSCTGNRWLRTPNIDSLARGGTRFANTWCSSPVCSPARASLISGLLPHATGVEYNGGFRQTIPTLGELFREAGYETAWVGKWHLPDGLPYVRVIGRDRSGPEQGRGFSFLPYDVANTPGWGMGDFIDRPISECAAAFLHRKHDQPFLLGVSLVNPHDICYWIWDKLPPRHPGAVEKPPAESELPPLPANFAVAADEPEFITRCRNRPHYGEQMTSTKSWDEAQWRRYLWAYYRMTERVDRAVGTVLDALRSSGLEDNTVVVFTSDHGEGMAAHRWVVKLMLWQEVVGVPLIFQWKGRIAAGRKDRQALASTLDITPTLCDLAGIRMPKPVHGSSLWPVLRDGGGMDRDSVFAHLAPDSHDRSLQARAVRSARYKYVSFSSGRNPEMLFDLDNDPGETRNLASAPEQRAELNRHRALLDEWVRKTGDPYRRGTQP